MYIGNYSKEELKTIVLISIKNRAITKEEIKSCAYSILDVLYEILSYGEYQRLFDAVALELDTEYDVYIC